MGFSVLLLLLGWRACSAIVTDNTASTVIQQTKPRRVPHRDQVMESTGGHVHCIYRTLWFSVELNFEHRDFYKYSLNFLLNHDNSL